MKTKELTIEEKAKAYDRAIANAKEQAIDGYLDAVAVNDIFPELAKSEDEDDEKIRKSIIEFVKQNKSFHYLLGVSKEDAVAWLEKQGEQKPAEWSEKEENIINNICDYIQGHTNFSDSCKEDAVHFLKSLRPQSTWRPSEKEIKEDCKFNKKEYSVNNGLDLGCGVIWKDEEPTSEELEEAANNAVIALVPSFGQKYSDGSYVSSCRDSFKREELIELFKAGANWQERKDEKNIGELQWNAHAEGWDECKQEMMKDAIDTTIKQGCTELVILIKGLNEDKFSFGDKVKIIVVKED